MADEAALVFALDARINKMERALARAEARAAAAGKKIETEFRKTNQKVTDGLAKSATGLSRLGQVTGAQRFVIQNTANQFGDLAVQIAGGTTVMRAMSQQAPQLLGGLGALGGTLGTLGPLMGVVAAVGLPLAAMFFNMALGSEEAADKAETLEDKIKNLSSAVSNYSEAANLALKGTGELADEYGRFASQAQLALDVQERLRRSAAQDAVSAAASGISVAFGSLDLGGGGDALAVPDVSDYEQTLRRLRDEMGLTADQSVQLVRALSAVANASGPEAQAAAFQALQSVLVSIYGSIEEANRATGGLVDKINEAVVKTLQLQAETEKVALASNMIAAAMASAEGAIAAATTTASSLAATIQNAATAAWDYVGALGAAANKQAAAVGGGRGLDPRQFEDDPYYRNRYFPTPQPLSRATRSSGGGSSNVNAQQAADLAKVKALYASTRTELERYNAEMEELQRLHREGKIDADLFARSVDRLDAEFGNSKVGDFKNGILDLATGVLSAEDAFDRLKAAIIRASAEYLLFGTGAFAAGSGGGIIKGILGSVFGGIPGFASGGNHIGGLRIVGENGPEVEATGPSRILPADVLARAASGAGGNTYITVHVPGATGNSEIMRMVQAGVSAGISQNNKRQYERQRRA
ncbi:hypothetical protein QKW60_05555 [Defluviimonas aestuarii]|uniref:hypothetical protein n=1 Tax=Albidovulum aestuarii TaxID=1130726 RepID=UPI00249BD66A|nr:hypothetical protein [Defluviimonas aestuarii]MDI3335862.1 hypothetical protein [Defluviimonas aestuarii]